MARTDGRAQVARPTRRTAAGINPAPPSRRRQGSSYGFLTGPFSGVLAPSPQQLVSFTTGIGSLVGAARKAQTLQVPPSFEQWRQLLQVVQAWQFDDPVQVAP